MEETRELTALVMASRPAIPAAMKRAIEQEAGYRCAVPTCRDKGPFDFEHIEPWSKVKKHKEHNIILLCVGCHARVTRGEINKNAIKDYKRNLAITNCRYSLYEMRLLELYHKYCSIDTEGTVRTGTEAIFSFREEDKLHFFGLLRDKYIALSESQTPDYIIECAEEFAQSGLFHEKFPDSKATADDLKEVMIRVAEGQDGIAKYSVRPTVEGMNFISDYFKGNKID